jgi:hypothetical protein
MWKLNIIFKILYRIDCPVMGCPAVTHHLFVLLGYQLIKSVWVRRGSERVRRGSKECGVAQNQGAAWLRIRVQRVPV